MQRWDTFLTAKARRAAGFTLLELVVVLALLGVVTALAMPNLAGLVASAQRATERDDLINQINALGQRARLSNSNLLVAGLPAAVEEVPAGFTSHQLEIPNGWTVEFVPPLVVRANGVCLGAELTLSHADAPALRRTLEPPFCNLDY